MLKGKSLTLHLYGANATGEHIMFEANPISNLSQLWQRIENFEKFTVKFQNTIP